MSRNQMYKKFYASDIFNTDPNFAKVSIKKPKIRINQSTLDNTKEDLFNINKEGRIRRSKDEDEKITGKNLVLSRSVNKRKINYDKIYGSDIFNKRKATSTQRRSGVKQIPNSTHKTTYLDDIRNNEEYLNELKNYTKEHRIEKMEYDPNLYMKKINPQERYYKDQFANHGILGTEENVDLEEKKISEYFLNKEKLKKISKKGKKEEEKNYKERRYVRQKPIIYEEKRKFLDLNEHPLNNSSINKQIQMESHLFSKDFEKKDFNEEVKEINDRIQLEKRKTYNTNVLGQPFKKIKRLKMKTDRNLLGSVNSRWRQTNLDWKDPLALVMFANTSSDSNKCLTARERRINQFADSENIDTLSGLTKRPIRMNTTNEIEENNKDYEKIDKMVEEIPNLKDGEKIRLKMKASVLDCKSDDEWDNKGKILNNYYSNKNYGIKKEKEITGKINNNNYKIYKDVKNNKDNLYHDYVITYATKGNNEFEKFDENEIQKLLGTKGIVAYDIHKNPFDKGNYNLIHLKIKGNDNNNELYNKVKKVQEDLRKKNYKINIEKGAIKNHGKKSGKMVIKPGSKIGVLNEDYNEKEESKFKIMPDEIKARKGFTKQFIRMDYGYKKNMIK